MKSPILYVSSLGLLLIVVTTFFFYKDIKRLRTYRSNVVIGVVYSMQPIDGHEFMKNHKFMYENKK